MVQLNATGSFLVPPAMTTHKIDVPQDQGERVQLTMIPDAEALDIKNEKMNSPNRLLTATYTYRIWKMLKDSATQRAMQEEYKVWAKQLSLCITGKCYLGGMDCKALVRKGGPQKLMEDPCQRSQPASETVLCHIFIFTSPSSI